jgi:hypothetical protein
MRISHSALSLALAFTCACFVLAPRAARGCTCISNNPPVCTQYWTADAVFTGRVRSTRYKSRGDDRHLVVELDKARAYKGVSGTRVTLDFLSTSCDPSFDEGRTYLVYAYRDRDTGRLGTTMCHGNTPIEYADGEVAYIKGVLAGKVPVLVSGIISEQSPLDPKAGVAVAVDSNGIKYRAETNEEGRFHVELAEPGPYIVTLEVGSGIYVTTASHYWYVPEDAKYDGRAVIKGTAGRGNCNYHEFTLHRRHAENGASS